MTPAFFDPRRDNYPISAMVADIGSTSLAESCASDTAKVQTTIICNRIIGHGSETNPDWRPVWMVRRIRKRGWGPGFPPNAADFAEQLHEDTGTQIPQRLRYSIDWDALARDMALNGEIMVFQTGFDEVHIFWAR